MPTIHRIPGTMVYSFSTRDELRTYPFPQNTPYLAILPTSIDASVTLCHRSCNGCPANNHNNRTQFITHSMTSGCRQVIDHFIRTSHIYKRSPLATLNPQWHTASYIP